MQVEAIAFDGAETSSALSLLPHIMNVYLSIDNYGQKLMYSASIIILHQLANLYTYYACK